MYLRQDIISAVDSLIESKVLNAGSHIGWKDITWPILDKFGPDYEDEAKEAAEELLRKHCPDFDTWAHDFERLCSDFKHGSFNHAGRAFNQAKEVGWKPPTRTGEEQLQILFEIQDKATSGEPEPSPYWLSKGFEPPEEAFTYKGSTYLPRYDEEGEITSYWSVYKKDGKFEKCNAKGLPATGFFSSIQPIYYCPKGRAEGVISEFVVEEDGFLKSYFQRPGRVYPAELYEQESHEPGFSTSILVFAESVPKYQAYEAALRHEGKGDLIDSKVLAFLCSFSCVNIPRHVAWVLKVRPDMRIVIIMDRSKDGKLSGEGWRKVIEVCRQQPQIHVVDPGEGYSDLDDLFRAEGPEAVSRCIAAARPLTQEEMDSAPRVDAEAKTASSQSAGGETQDWIGEMNGRYYPAQVGAKMAVAFTAESALGYPEVRLVTFHTFREMHSSQYAVMGYDDKGKPIIKPKSDWLNHPARNPNRELIFDPGAPAWADREGYLNLWFGFRKFGDAERGNPDVMLEHIREVICASDPEKFDYLLKWLAYCIQFPQRRPEVAVVLMGLKGCGKGTLGQLLVHIFGGHGVHVVNRDHITGRFNGHLSSAVFVFADEAFFHNDHKSEGVLKALVTEPTQLLERKGIDALPMPNRISLMMASNDDHVVNAGIIERRYFVAGVSPSKIGDRAYFDRMARWRENGDNIESFIRYLQGVDIQDFNPRMVPTTRELTGQKALSLPALEQWLVESLSVGSFKGTQGDWVPVATLEALGCSYDDWCDRMKKFSYDRISRDRLAKKLGKLLTTPRRKIRHGEKALRIVDGHLEISALDPLSTKYDRFWVYELGTLEEMRTALIATLQLDPDTFEEA